MQYSIWIVAPPNYSHSQAFDEVALALRDAFRELGHQCKVTLDPAQAEGETIVLGANVLPPGTELPPNFIVYNLEQVTGDSSWMSEGYLRLLGENRVWDYSPLNITALAQKGIAATLCEIGYMPALTRIAPPPYRDIDVAFIGSMNDRRKRLLQAIAAHDKNVFAGFDMYGDERDAMLARAKIVINIHFYQSKVLEMVRCSYLMANRICVVSETGADTELERSLQGAIAFAPYERLAETCLRLLDDREERQRIAGLGYEWFAARSLVPMLKRALETTPHSSPY